MRAHAPALILAGTALLLLGAVVALWATHAAAQVAGCALCAVGFAAYGVASEWER